MSRSLLELLEEFEELGYVLRDCPECMNECEATEVDNEEAFCNECGEVVFVGALL